MPSRTGVDEVLRGAVDRGDVPLVVAMAADRDGVIYEGAAGDATPETIFRIASMTKMVATVAALQLTERGELDFDEPVETFLPEFAELQVLEGFDGDTPHLRPPSDKATVRHLVTHTSGLAYWFWNGAIVQWQEATGTPTVLSGEMSIFTAPLVADPGTRYEYGISTDWLGRVVEAASGMTLRDFVAGNILAPLGMDTTDFLPKGEVTPICTRAEDGAWEATDIDWNQEPAWWAGGHGLYSTPRDYLRFQRMLLHEGTFDGAQILRPETVREAFRNQIGELDFPDAIATADPGSSADFNAGPGYKWGLGLLLNTDDVPGMRAAGSGAWAGLFNTHFWVDPASGVTGAIYSQTLPFAEPRVLGLYQDFERALYASLADEPEQRRFVREGERIAGRNP